jgi:hypothetical protein
LICIDPRNENVNLISPKYLLEVFSFFFLKVNAKSYFIFSFRGVGMFVLSKASLTKCCIDTFKNYLEN